MTHIIDCIGHTPLLHLERISRLLGAHVYVKLETMNPGSSIKDRVALAYIQGAMQRGEIQTGGCVVEASSGNLGLALAHVCAKLDIRLLLCMPASVERAQRAFLHDLGAQVFVTPAEDGMTGARERADFHNEDTWGSFRPNPFVNPDGPKAYFATLGVEIVEAAQKASLSVDAFVCGIGSGATFTGVGRRLREHNPAVFLGAVEPAESAVLSGHKLGKHGIPGIGSGMIPTVLDQNLITQIFTVSTSDAIKAQKRLLGMEAIKAGRSSGANLHAALMLAQQPSMKGKNIFTVIHDGRY